MNRLNKIQKSLAIIVFATTILISSFSNAWAVNGACSELPSGFAGIATGTQHTCILKSDGNVDCYGSNSYGQAAGYIYGDAIALAAGNRHTCVLTVDGNVDCFGYNRYGQADDYMGGDARGVSAGNYHTCVLKSDGNVYCYGANSHGQVVGYYGGDAQGINCGVLNTCILKTDGDVICYGRNNKGQSEDYNGGDALAVSTGSSHTCILKSDGNVECYGDNSYGRADDYLGGDALGVVTGLYHTCILQSGGGVKCYGRNYYGQADEYIGVGALGVAAGASHTCIVEANGNVKCNGQNAYGEATDYYGGDAICSIRPESSISLVDIISDLFEIEIKIGGIAEEPDGEFLEVIVELYEGFYAWEIDVSSITLSKDGIALATAEGVELIKNTLKVKFPISLANVEAILDMEVKEVEIAKGGVVNVKVGDDLTSIMDLVRLDISGSLIGGALFSGYDSICLMHMD